MKRNWLYLILAAVTVLAMPACSSSDDDDSGSSSGTSTGGAITATETGQSSWTSAYDLSIAINKEALDESESVPTDESEAYYEDYVENYDVASQITITYNGTTASVDGSADGVSIDVDGADVVVTSTTKNVEYILTGTTDDGMFKMADGDNNKKFKLTLDGVTMTNNDGPCINIQIGKRCYVVANEGTVNTFTDGSTSYADSDEDQKGTVFSEGELLFSGEGTISVYSKAKNGIVSDDYIFIRPNTNIYVNSSSNHCIKSNDSIVVMGGVVNCETSAQGGKGLKTDGLYVQYGGRVTAVTTGSAYYDSDEQDVTGSAGLKADSTITINGGELFCKSTGKGGKGISTDQTFTINDGTVAVLTSAAAYTYNSSLDSKSKGIKADGNVYINGGEVVAKTTGGEGSEGIESKAEMFVNSGSVSAYSYDDCLNSSGNMYVNGGYIWARATNNDGLDANCNLYFYGGTTVAMGGSQPECGIDANEEENYTVYFMGGNVFAIGGAESSHPTNTASTQGYITGSGSVSSGTLSVATTGGTTLASFYLPYSYSNGQWIITVDGMTSGTKYAVGNSSSTTYTAVQYSSSSQGFNPTGTTGRPGGGGPGR